jgi:hypothetical protein
MFLKESFSYCAPCQCPARKCFLGELQTAWHWIPELSRLGNRGKFADTAIKKTTQHSKATPFAFQVKIHN